jgi:signal peptidase I
MGHPAEELAAQVLRRGEPLRIKARGGSMLPFIWDGDVALVTPAAPASIAIGDVVCYESTPGRLFLHRIIRRDGDRFVTKGDALSATEVIEGTQLLGKMVAFERRGRINRLDTRAARWWNRAVVCVSPVVPRLLALTLRLRRVLRAALHG